MPVQNIRECVVDVRGWLEFHVMKCSQNKARSRALSGNKVFLDREVGTGLSGLKLQCRLFHCKKAFA